MDAVCPTNIDLTKLNVAALTNGTFLDTANAFLGLPAYDAEKLPGYGYTTGAGTYTAKLFSILNLVPASRYQMPGSGEYWQASRSSAALDTSALMNQLNSTNVPGKNYKMITPQQELASALTGNQTEQKTAVSYDFLYSLQFEFCFWARVYRILIGDFIKVQNTVTTTSGFTESQKNETLRQLVNSLNSVNLRLTDLTKIAQATADSQRNGVSQMNGQVNQFLTNISNNVKALEENRKDLTSKDVASRFRARMLEYSEEKNAYANQMLALYGFANLIALGLLFYIYKS